MENQKFQVNKTDEDWKQQLSEEEYRILREKGTEQAFSGEYDIQFKDGTYHCAGCKICLLYTSPSPRD